MFDTHLHPVASDDARYPRMPARSGRTPSPAAANPVEAIVQHLDAAGVEQAALVQFTTVYEYDNAYCIDSVAAYPDRFIGVCAVDPFAADAPEALARLVEQGMRGLRLFSPAGWVTAGSWPDEPTVHPILHRAAALSLPVAVQMRPQDLPHLAGLVGRYPSLPFLVDHLAGVTGTEGDVATQTAPLRALASLPNLYLKFSNRNFRQLESGGASLRQLLETLLASFGPQRLLWGSNFPADSGSPQAPYVDLVEEARAELAFLPAQDREALLGGNALRLYLI